MPAPAQAKPKPELPPNKVAVAGKQEHFQKAGFALAESLGWKGEPDHETVGITVADAQNWLVKTLHEHFQAGAKDEAAPDHLATCEHLSITDEAEQELVRTALAKAYESGKGATVEVVDKTHVAVGADLVGKE